MQKTFITILFAVAMLCAGTARSETLVFGAISDNERQDRARSSAFLSTIAENLVDHGVTAVELQVFQTVDALSKALADGDVDIFMDSPLVVAQVIAQSNAVPFLQRWKNGVGSYRSIIFVRSDAPIFSLKDLQGRLIGLEERASSSGYLLPISMLLSAGQSPLHQPERIDYLPQDHVSFKLTYDDKNTLFQMIKGELEAAATDEQNFSRLNTARPGIFRIVATSMELPRNIVVHSPTMAPERTALLTTVLLTLDDTPDGRAALETYEGTAKFDALPDNFDQILEFVQSTLSAIREAGFLDTAG